MYAHFLNLFSFWLHCYLYVVIYISVVWVGNRIPARLKWLPVKFAHQLEIAKAFSFTLQFLHWMLIVKINCCLIVDSTNFNFVLHALLLSTYLLSTLALLLSGVFLHFPNTYSMYKKSCPFLYKECLIKMDIQKRFTIE